MLTLSIYTFESPLEKMLTDLFRDSWKKKFSGVLLKLGFFVLVSQAEKKL